MQPPHGLGPGTVTITWLGHGVKGWLKHAEPHHVI